ncbi:FKBP-type peptidyl-prolyl cis-trans isomerase [Rhodopirellula sallentina]|uniref:Peptidyl-prolyl cis-trans isomerase n=1 Tax=Rhodopirellula sallentina SM41 TaxID=1263870 RepID=M5TVJ4_9BACT|nr:FKBP-type peptidyl-prolyl cis-trans isomerase [Rhodopirellula sallentina]EMI53079.1 FKBP-type peptidyl-prolyl cis-trans isomerase [Rhodopirellula sallentina SM41]
MKVWLSWCLLGCILVFSGCRSTGKTSPEIPPEMLAAFSEDSLAAASTSTVSQPSGVTFVDLPELQSGTGPMDAGEVPAFSATGSGLKYRILRKSSGRKPTAADTVSVHYRGWLHSGKVFDSSYERGEPTSFPLKSVVAGWTEGMQLVGEGGMIELYVPSHLGYGERGSPGSIPPHANLHFIVELVSVN